MVALVHGDALAAELRAHEGRGPARQVLEAAGLDRARQRAHYGRFRRRHGPFRRSLLSASDCAMPAGVRLPRCWGRAELIRIPVRRLALALVVVPLRASRNIVFVVTRRLAGSAGAATRSSRVRAGEVVASKKLRRSSSRRVAASAPYLWSRRRHRNRVKTAEAPACVCTVAVRAVQLQATGDLARGLEQLSQRAIPSKCARRRTYTLLSAPPSCAPLVTQRH